VWKKKPPSWANDMRIATELVMNMKENQLYYKLIGENAVRKSFVYEARYKGYRVVIEERAHLTEYLIEHRKKGLLWKSIHLTGTIAWIEKREDIRLLANHDIARYSKARDMFSTYFFQKFTDDHDMFIQKAWKERVSRCKKEFLKPWFPHIAYVRRHSFLYKAYKTIIPAYVQLYIHRYSFEEEERNYYITILPQTVLTLMEEYDALPNEYKNHDKDMENVLYMVSKKYQDACTKIIARV